MMHQNGAYWVFHKNYIDETVDQVLEKKPEEKIWRVVRDTRCPEMEMACYRLQKQDLIKVGRVRFKIRDIMSPVYREIENGVDIKHETHREMFPSVINDSISSSVMHNDNSSEDEMLPAGQGEGADAAAIAEAHQNALLTESDDEPDAIPELQHANTIAIQGGINEPLGMNADDLIDDPEDRDGANNTQFEPGSQANRRMIGQQKTGSLKMDDEGKPTLK